MSFLANRNVQIFNSTMSVSTLNTSAMAISTLTGSTLNASSINVSTLSGSTLNASTMTGNQITISTLTVSSINNGTPGVAAYSTLNVSSLNTSSITTSSIITAPGYNSNIGNILYTSLADSGQTAANLTTASMPATVPAGSVISGSYRLTAGASSGAAVMWLGSYAYTAGTTYNFTFTGMQGSQALVLYVYQYNTAGTASIQISSNVYNITTSAATVSGSFTANLYPATYTGSIVFYFQAAAVNQYVNFTAFSMTTGTMNVGIGTASPNALLCVGPNGGVNQSGFLPGISMTSVSGQNMFYSVGQGTAGTNNIHMGWVYNATAASGYGHVSCYGGNNSLILQSGSGNVGIGVTGPSYALDVAGFVRATSGLLAGNGTGAVSLQLLDLPTASWQISTGGYNLSINNNSSSWTNRFTISETGNVGIGVAAPSTKLHIYDSSFTNVIRMQTSVPDNAYIVATTEYLFLSANYTSSGTRDNVGRGSSQIVIHQPQAGGLITFNTSPSINTDVQERMRIASNGNILMNTPSTFGANGLLQITSSGGTTQDGISCRAVIDGNFIFSCHNTAGTFRGGILGVNSASVSFATSSDRRLKDNIHPIEGSLSIVNQLKPVHFRWKNDDQYDFGFIAQDVYKVLPHLRSNFSSYIKDCSCQKNDLWNGTQCDHCLSMNDEPVDEEGNPKYYSLDYGKFSPYLIGAVKELTERNTHLESENAQLKSQVTSLSASHASLLAWAQTQGFVQ